MFCSKCQSEIPLDSLFCNKCGNPIETDLALTEREEKKEEINQLLVEIDELLDEDKGVIEKTKAQKVELTAINLEMDKAKKKKIIFSMIGIVAIIVIAFGGYSYYTKQQEKTYKANIDILMTEMLASGSTAESLMNITSKVWYNTIYKKSDSETDKYTHYANYPVQYKDSSWTYNDDFNQSLKLLFNDSSTKSKISEIEASQKKISEIMKKLQNPPESYKASYSTILELYSAYQGLTDLAISPKGSLQSFGNSKTEKVDKFLELYKKLQTQLPE